ncbi:flagellar basal body-associated FliL family protein [Jatrophihabitans sp.]|uniref:flagellar basal body-associated FliL family protein n=1 Tax=Jatrophihabitans sp. TaxID=1932789 RepID=UPI002C608AD6|nr:flagellar basal body-associated FliL family protein [Jatrophihabitans sp.]
MTMTATDRPDRIANEVSSKGGRAGAKGNPAETGKAAGKQPGKKKSKKKFIVLAVVVLLLGAVAKFTVLKPSGAAADAKPVPGHVLAMPDMTLNLAGGHYLRIKLALQTVEGTSEELDTSEASQAVIEVFSDRPVAELTGEAARSKAKKELLVKLQKVYPKQIMDVIYTEFFTQ